MSAKDRSQAPAVPAVPAPLYRPFEWHDIPPGNPTSTAADFAGLTRDIAGGVRLLVGILEQDTLSAEFVDAAGNDVPRLLSPLRAGTATRFCLAALHLLGDEAARFTERLNKAARPQTAVVQAPVQGGEA